MPAAFSSHTGKEAAFIVHISPLIVFALLAIGLGIGVISGMVGIGGGVLVIPVLILAFGFSQARANGTSLAMLLPPIGIFAVLEYHNKGNINWTYALLLALGFAVGARFGAVLINSQRIDETVVRRAFLVLLFYIAGRMLWRDDPQLQATLKTLALVVGTAVAYVAARLIGRRWDRAPYWPSVYRQKLRAPVGHDYEI
jgi:uncharacterized membrane protein YfcA